MGGDPRNLGDVGPHRRRGVFSTVIMCHYVLSLARISVEGGKGGGRTAERPSESAVNCRFREMGRVSGGEWEEASRWSGPYTCQRCRPAQILDRG